MTRPTHRGARRWRASPLRRCSSLAALVPTQAAAQNFLWKATRSQRHRLSGRLGPPADQGLLPAQSRARRRRSRTPTCSSRKLDLAEMTAADSAAQHADARHAAGRSVARQGGIARHLRAGQPSASRRSACPIEPLKRFKPWMLALTLLSLEWQKAGFDAGSRPRQALLRSRARRGQDRPGPRDAGFPDLALRRDDAG